MYKLVLVRHGESTWNQENRFTGWTDVDLTAKGEAEAREAGRLLHEAGYAFDVAYTSVLKRAIRTLWLMLDEMDQMWVPVINDWRLNERHYGALQGLNKAETAKQFGAEQVQTWRRSYDIVPPDGESLAMTVARALPYFKQKIVPHLEKGENVFIVAHGNSLRGIVMHLDGLPKEEVVKLEIATGAPLIYSYDKGIWKKES